MPTSGPSRPVRDDGSVLEATFELSRIPVFDIVFHHKAGARDSPRSANADYHEALEVLLGRLASVNAEILGISVDSGPALELPPADRELAIDFPIQLDATIDVKDLRLSITRAQKPVARRPDASPGGGNDQKRIRITVTFPDPDLEYDAVYHLLVGAVPADDRAPEEETGSEGTVTKHELQGWVLDALRRLGGRGSVVEVANEVWTQHEAELRASGDLFFTWQYDLRWAAQALRDRGWAKPAHEVERGIWELAE